eukprot:5313944-Prymnesium_polylepis.1
MRTKRSEELCLVRRSSSARTSSLPACGGAPSEGICPPAAARLGWAGGGSSRLGAQQILRSALTVTRDEAKLASG